MRSMKQDLKISEWKFSSWLLFNLRQIPKYSVLLFELDCLVLPDFQIGQERVMKLREHKSMYTILSYFNFYYWYRQRRQLNHCCLHQTMPRLLTLLNFCSVFLPWNESILALINILSLATSCLFSSSNLVLTWWLTKSSSLLNFPLCQEINGR